MPEQMRALVFDKSQDIWEESRGLRKVQVDRPVLDAKAQPLDAEMVIIKVIYCGVCGSDRGIWFRDSFKELIHSSLEAENKTQRITGHELLGEIVEVGGIARAHYGWQPGDTVSADSHTICGKCRQCLIGESHVCTNEQITGIGRDGCFADYVKLPAWVLWRTDTDRIRPEIACLQDPFGNAVHVCTKVDLRGKSLAVFGCGTIGLFAILIARALGASKIIGVQPSERNARLAERLGVDSMVRFERTAKGVWQSDPAVVEQVRDFGIGGNGVDVALEMAGHNSSVNNAVQSVRRGGEVVLFGLKDGDATIEDFHGMIVRGVSLHSVIGRQIFRTWDIANNLLESKHNDIQEQIYEVILNRGEGTIVDIDDYQVDDFEQRLLSHPKIITKW